MSLAPEMMAIIEQAFSDVLSSIPVDDYSHEDDVLFGVVLGIMYIKGWRHNLTAEERSFVYRCIESFLQQFPK